MWYYDLSPDATRAAIVERDGSTVADLSVPAHTTAATNFPDTLAMMTAAPVLLDALRALTDAVKQYAPLCKDRPEYAQALRAIERASPALNLYHIHDSGHGWIGIDHATLDRLGIASEISPYSYRGQTVAWLEEDRDAEILLRALSIAGITYRIRDEHIDGDAPIRMLPRWSNN
jgi:hypothetical protein